ncbi:MAG TPA: hydantoinase B/oxoprolinase family protein [Bryobacteraceae bacterium]|jgi:N-methylhydantoinase B/oxoprolinase/acetone carboxylase alpha subunit|nr:hydantoinase B/oxoprolinase family protein [Bryobacteraceae bacterium]
MKPDPIELELFRHLLVSIAEEMGAVLRKTSYSANIKERRDYSCAVYDAAGETVAMGDHMPVHLGAMPLSVRHAMQAFDFAQGDVAILNDPFRGGTHLPDITAVSGVFVKGSRKPAFYVANRAHHADVGGMSPGSMPLAREIYQEGIRIPPILLARRGKFDRELLALILANVRTPEEREGDLLAQCMAIRRGEQRLLELVAKYGMAKVRRNMTALKDYSERMIRAAISRLPRGEYRFEDYLDNDGIVDRPVKIAVTVTIHGNRATIDFTGSSEQVEGSVNANYAVAVSATTYVFRCLVREDIPYTAGVMRPLEVNAPVGSVVNAQPPAAMAAGNVETSQRITDVVLGALAQAAPELIPAASSGTMNNITFGGMDRLRKRAFAYYETIAGGMGASAISDGSSATHTHMTNSWNTPVEAFEHQYPLRIRGYRIRSGSGGAGRHRGGDGIIREFEFLTPADVTILADRRSRGPYGLAGGAAGAPGKNTLLKGKRAILIPGKARFEVEAGDVLRIESPGGGGYGKPD